MAGTEAHSALPSLGWERLRPCAMNDYVYTGKGAGHIDAHTHAERRNAIVDIDPCDYLKAEHRAILRKGFRYSVGIHPFNLRRASSEALRLLRSLAAEPRVVAIGECGLDALAVERGLTREELIAAQTELLLYHIELSESLKKPLILHIVRTFPEIISLKKQLKPSQRWIIHGFRGKAQLAQELIRHGFTLSFGHRYNPEAFALTPSAQLLRESDESET